MGADRCPGGGTVTDPNLDWTHAAFLATAGARALELAVGHAAVSERLHDHALRAIRLGRDFGEEPEGMGVEMATLWQQRALEVAEAGEFLLWQTTPEGLIISMAAQVAGLVNEIGRRLGGAGEQKFGFALIVPEHAPAVNDAAEDYWCNLRKPREWRADLGRAPRVDAEPTTMVEFLFGRAREFSVPAWVIAELRRPS